MNDCLISGIGSAVPADDLGAWLAGPSAPSADFDPLAKLDKRKLRYKDRATILALAATQAALDASGIVATPRIEGGFLTTGVVAASNFGNMDTVCRTIETIAAGSASDTSPLDLPNASPNAIAATIAIYFGAGALNLMATSGPDAGADAVALAARAIRAGRAERMIVVGVEPASDPVRRLLGEEGLEIGDDFEGAAALVLTAERPAWGGYARLAEIQANGVGEGTPVRPELRPGAHWSIARIALAAERVRSGALSGSEIPGAGARATPLAAAAARAV